MPNEKNALVQRIRHQFGTFIEAFETSDLELSDVEMQVMGHMKQRTFDETRANDLAERWDSTQLTAATVLIVTDPKSASVEKNLREELVKNTGKQTPGQLSKVRTY